jgi:hypothetical protein
MGAANLWLASATVALRATMEYRRQRITTFAKPVSTALSVATHLLATQKPGLLHMQGTFPLSTREVHTSCVGRRRKAADGADLS